MTVKQLSLVEFVIPFGCVCRGYGIKYSLTECFPRESHCWRFSSMAIVAFNLIAFFHAHKFPHSPTKRGLTRTEPMSSPAM
jgi:hypothetical protein